jgi:hypothetical protein
MALLNKDTDTFLLYEPALPVISALIAVRTPVGLADQKFQFLVILFA